jgi:hypothetical protein
MAQINYAHVYAGAGFSGEQFNIAAGPADTSIIDVLLSVGDGALTEDAPHVLVSTGALGGARALDISAMEVESAAKGGQALNGRIFYLSVQNSDISGTNTLTISGTTSINGSATLVISNTGDYLFHHVSGGVWRVNVLPTPAEKLATMARVSFAASDWDAGASKNTIKVLQTGTPAAGEVGPHLVTPYGSYVVQVINTDLTPEWQHRLVLVDVEIQFAPNGDITLRKSPKAADFAGVVLIVGTLD